MSGFGAYDDATSGPEALLDEARKQKVLRRALGLAEAHAVRLVVTGRPAELRALARQIEVAKDREGVERDIGVFYMTKVSGVPTLEAGRRLGYEGPAKRVQSRISKQLKRGRAALWVGAIDDLWKFGKPVGQGGPWHETKVAANAPSDPYLMTGYDNKTLILKADKDVDVTLEVDVDHQSGWHKHHTLNVKAGRETRHTFDTGFSAHWVRLIADRPATITATFIYD